MIMRDADDGRPADSRRGERTRARDATELAWRFMKRAMPTLLGYLPTMSAPIDAVAARVYAYWFYLGRATYFAGPYRHDALRFGSPRSRQKAAYFLGGPA